ncbi:hypothetical protein SODALDRAFT_309783 [Sodiomyces alkalinus F11]|uniref:BHLH domain-containing protein n=1 Tax=Sodiomyces alkalinus (strain CBS 110278 / VKM F-3762 / F11) TaxID=1314773 RepID=A0A3N2Q057_SODAK|nr:hypothetical protein SODALDRAFT_309783 [Sodiomyces alkalinus F11]ROT40066.1 hypothetical protein SODALDRAFT_309783 [Sodiomyces alkalinus F11]
MMESTVWNTQDQSLPPSHDDDFPQFLDMGDTGGLDGSLQFDFQDFQPGHGSSIMSQNPRDQLDTPMRGSTDATTMVMTASDNTTAQSQLIAMSSAASHPSIPAHMMHHPPTPNDPISQIDAQIQFLQQQQRQMQEQQAQQQAAYYASQTSAQVPPTPQSLEMPSNGNHFYPHDQHQQNMFDTRYQHMKEQQDMAFTPLVSPAVTPLDPHFQMDANFGLSGAYFSPLTSPALHAQSESSSPYDQRNSISTRNSPGEMDLENCAPAAAASGVDLSKKARKNNASRAKGKASVRQSPISKPQKKKMVPTPQMVSQVLSDLQESAEDGMDQVLPPSFLPAPMSSEESENASVSPETLSDMPALSEMPPPPPPTPQSRLVKLLATAAAPPSALPPGIQGKPSPATPASLMKLPSSSANGGATSSSAQEGGAPEHIENLELPESANFAKMRLSPLDTNRTPVQCPSEPNSARVSAFQPLPSPVFAKPRTTASANQSPIIAPGSSGPAPRKTPQLAPRNSKKRGSISSSHVSPALRPRISPHIKPLLPGTPGLTAEDSASRLLATKSNYQNILEGNTVPGVTYPMELSTNLTSKRTSHKIAEQGRRNRINSALQEIAALLPKSATTELKSSECEKDGGKPGCVPNSKASTVEMAIEYIKQLRQEVAEATARAEKAEKKLEEKEKGSVS